MNLAAIPAELRARPQWVVWRTVIVNGRPTKPPFQARHLQFGADHSDPSTWATYEEAVACLNANPSLVSGIGYVFSEDDDFFGIDIDDEGKVDPSLLDHRREVVNQIVNRSTSYAEISPSGTGLHIIGRGKLPIAGRRTTKLQLEIYGSQRFFTITGNVYNGRSEIRDEQQVADWLFGDHLGKANDNGSASLEDVGVHRRLDLSDEDVIREATNFSPTFAPRFNAQIGCGPGEWSETFIAVIGVLDQVTGKVDQLQRIVMASPMVTQAPASNAGESRASKAARNFSHVLARVRGNNTGFLSAVAHGRSIMEAIRARQEQQAKEVADRILANAEAAFSRKSVELLKAFPINPAYLELALPPGIVGEYVQATVRSCHNPFVKFALPATLATLAGLVGRSYKLSSGSGLNANFLLVAPSSTGKTQTMDAWEHFMTRAAQSIGNTVAGPAKNRIVKASAASIQGIYEDFMHMPSCAWFISECGSQLKQMSDPKSSIDSQLRDAYNDLYDVSKIGRIFSPPRSVANRKAQLEPINNLCVSTYWTTTPQKFDVFSEDAQDGFLSRVVVVRHTGPAGEAVPDWDVIRGLPDELHQRLVTQMALAKAYDEKYLIQPQDAYSFTTIVSTEAIEGQVWAFRQIAERIKNASLSGDMPAGYTAVSRLPMTALRIAGVLAVMDNPYTPAIMPEHFEWAFGYLLQNTAAILSDMDTGELGDAASDETMAIVRGMKKLLAEPRNRKVGGVIKSELREYVKSRAPFHKGLGSLNRSQRVTETLLHMMREGMITEFQTTANVVGRPKTYLAAVDSDPIWRT